MKKKREHKLLRYVLCVIIIFMSIVAIIPINTSIVYADMGPKPVVEVEFLGLEQETYYVTLLSETSGSGPYSADDSWDGSYDEAIWNTFDEYVDSDGFYFLGEIQDCSGKSLYTWSYYPPEIFKVLVYLPEYDTFLISDVCERYAFESYYVVDVGNLDIQENMAKTERIQVIRSYNDAYNISGFLLRMLTTIFIEVGIGLLFGFYQKKQIGIIAFTNGMTQIVLNILLYLSVISGLGILVVFIYFASELLVVIIEGIIYSKSLWKYEQKDKKRHPVLYAIVANLVSYGLGFIVMCIFPALQ